MVDFQYMDLMHLSLVSKQVTVIIARNHGFPCDTNGIQRSFLIVLLFTRKEIGLYRVRQLYEDYSVS